MIINNFEKSKKELKELKEQNNEKIYIYDERARLAEANQWDFKILFTLFFSMLGYMVLLIPSVSFLRNSVTSIIASGFPISHFPVILFGGSIAIGTVIKTLMFNIIFKCKKRFKSFSNARTEKDKLEEYITYKIELEKVKNRNKIINETIKLLDSEQKILNKVSNSYELNNKIVSKTKGDFEQRLEELSNIVNEHYEKLDLFTTQKVLHDKFWEIREKYQRKLNTMVVLMLSVIITTFFTGIPLIILRNIFSFSLVSSLATLLLGIIGSGAYMIKRNNNYKKVFNKINSKLGENALVDSLKLGAVGEEQRSLDRLLEQQIKDISILEKQIKENQRTLDLVQNTNINECRETLNKDKEIGRNLNGIYQLSDETKQNISRTVGLSYEEIINIDFESLERYIEQKIGKKPTYDLRLRIDGIPIDEEHILTLELLDDEMDKVISRSKKLVRKRNK